MKGIAMNRDEYKNKLVQSFFDEANNHDFELALDESLPQAPLNNFFNDVFLTLLFRCNDALAEHLIENKQHLLGVADLKQPRHVRAESAVALVRDRKSTRLNSIH